MNDEFREAIRFFKDRMYLSCIFNVTVLSQIHIIIDRISEDNYILTDMERDLVLSSWKLGKLAVNMMNQTPENHELGIVWDYDTFRSEVK